MTAAASQLLHTFKTLPPAEQALVREEMNELAKARQREAVKRFRGSSEGEGLLALLLEDRRKERDRDGHDRA